MRSAGRKNRPSASVTRTTTVPLEECLTVTVAPGSTAPELSFTTPPISPVLVCATDDGPGGEQDESDDDEPFKKGRRTTATFLHDHLCWDIGTV